MVFQVEQIRADIRDFHQSSGVDKVIVLWTANTERFCDVVPGVNDTAKNLLAAIQVRARATKRLGSQTSRFIMKVEEFLGLVFTDLRQWGISGRETSDLSIK